MSEDLDFEDEVETDQNEKKDIEVFNDASSTNEIVLEALDVEELLQDENEVVEQSCPENLTNSKEIIDEVKDLIQASVEKVESDAVPNKEEEDGEFNSDGEIAEEGEINDLEEGEINEEKTTEVSKKKSQMVCRFFKRGHCYFGSACQFLHVAEDVYKMFHRPPAPLEELRPYPPEICHFGAFPPAPPFLDNAWEKGLEMAKIMKQKAIQKRDDDVEFEIKKMYFRKSLVEGKPNTYFNQREEDQRRNNINSNEIYHPPKDKFANPRSYVDSWSRSKSPKKSKESRSSNSASPRRARRSRTGSSLSTSSNSSFDKSPSAKRNLKRKRRSFSKSSSQSQSSSISPYSRKTFPSKRKVSLSSPETEYRRVTYRSPVRKSTKRHRYSTDLSVSSVSDASRSSSYDSDRSSVAKNGLSTSGRSKTTTSRPPYGRPNNFEKNGDRPTNKRNSDRLKNYENTLPFKKQPSTAVNFKKHSRVIKENHSSIRSYTSPSPLKGGRGSGPVSFTWKDKRVSHPIKADFSDEEEYFNDISPKHGHKEPPTNENVPSIAQHNQHTKNVPKISVPATTPKQNNKKIVRTAAEQDLMRYQKGGSAPKPPRATVATPPATFQDVKEKGSPDNVKEPIAEVTSVSERSIALNLQPKSTEKIYAVPLKVGSSNAKQALTKREVLLQQLRLVEDAIARKKQ